MGSGAYADSGPAVATAFRERRRAPRRQFFDAVEVSLYAGEWDCPLRAMLLNLGPGGLACRISRRAGWEWPSVGRIVRVVFTLDSDAEPFALRGRVISDTTAGSTGHWVLGMEFLREEMAAPNGARLRAALRAAETGRK